MIELDYSLSSDDDDFDDEYVYTPENSSFNTIISVSITTDSILYSGLYKDTLTFEVNAVPKVIESLTNNSDIYEQEIIKEEMNIEPIENDTNDDSCTVYLYADEDILSKYIIEESEIFVDDNKEDNIYTASAIFKTDEVEELSLLPAISKKEGTKLEAHWIKQSELQTKDVYYTVVIKEIELIETVEEDIEN